MALDIYGGGNQDKERRLMDTALFTLEQWNEKYPGGLKINGNWFDIKGAPGLPHIYPCTRIFGLSVSNGKFVSSYTTPDITLGEKNYLDALIIKETALRRIIKIVENENIKQHTENIKQAISGFIILKDSKVIMELPKQSVKPGIPGARSAIGIRNERDGSQTLYVIFVQPIERKGGITAFKLARYLKSLGATDAINLDNSGSSQMLFNTLDGSVIKTRTEERDAKQDVSYRPIPNFIMISKMKQIDHNNEQ